jgi:hypothetical protein
MMESTLPMDLDSPIPNNPIFSLLKIIQISEQYT